MEDTLREGLSSSQRSQVSSETERFSDREVSLDLVKRSTSNGFFFIDNTSSLVKTLVDTTHSIHRSSNFSQEDGFLESGLSSEFTSVVNSSGSGDNLTTTSVDSIGVEGNIDDVDSDLSHVFFTQDTFLGGPLESGFHGISDFVHELNSLSQIDQKVRSLVFRSEGPDSSGFFLIPTEFFVESLGSDLRIILGAQFVLFNDIGKTFFEGLSGTVESVVLVGGLGQADLVGDGGDGFLVCDDGIRLLDFTVSVFSLEILQANFDVEFTATSNNVLTGFFVVDLDERIRLGELVQTIDKLGQILGILGFDGNSDDRRDGVLHDSDVVGIIEVRDGTSLDEVLIDTDQTDSVTTRNIGDVFNGSTHHQDSSLNGLEGQVILLSGLVVGTHNSDLLSSVDSSGEDSTESEESTLIGGGNHLGDVEHQRTLRITFSDTLSSSIILRTFVKVGNSVFLGDLGGRKVKDHHFKKSIGSIEPLGHDALEEDLALLFLFFGGEGEVNSSEHLVHLINITFDDGSGQSDNGVHTELDESSLKSLSTVRDGFGLPFLAFRIEIVVTPKLVHQLILVNLELVRVHLSESGQSESPAFLTRTESDITLSRVDEEITHIRLFVVGDNDVNQIDDSDEVLVHGFTVKLEFKNTSVDLVNHENWSDLFSHSLSEDSFGLDTDTFDTIDDNESTIGNSKSSCDFRRKIDVSWGIDQVDKIFGFSSAVVDVVLVEKRDTSGLDGNTSFLFIFSGIGVTSITGFSGSNDTGLGNQGISQGGLSVIDVSNDGHVSDVLRLVHDSSDFFNGKVDHFRLNMDLDLS